MPVSIPVGLPFRVLVVFFASSLAMSAYGAQPPAAPQKVASTIPVWEFRGLRPGSTTETALVADSQWGQPVLRTAHANALEVLYYKVARYGVDVSIRGGIVQSIDIALPAETSLDEVIRAFNLKDPLSDRPLPRSAAVGPSLPEGLEARQFACGRLVVFVSPNDGKPVARVIRFYGPDAVVEHPYLAVLRLRGYGALLEDFQYLGELSGSARFAGDIRKSFRDSQLAQGFSSPEDATRPWIVGIRQGTAEPALTVFVPTSDIGSLLRRGGPVVLSLSETLPGQLEFMSPATGLHWYATQHSARWAAISNYPLADKKLVDDPERLTLDFPSGYDLAIRFYVAKVPVDTRKEWLGQIKGALESASAANEQQNAGATSEPTGANEALSRHTLESFVLLLGSVEQVTVGWSLDENLKTAELDVVTTPKPDTRLAAGLEKNYDGTHSGFGGFHFPDAAVSLHACGRHNTDDLSQWESNLPLFRKNFLQSLNSQSSSAEQIAVFDSLWDSVIRAVDDTVRSGRSDLGAAIVYRGGKWTGLAGVQLANASTLDPPLRKFLASVAGEDAKVRIRLDAERLADMTFHTVSGPIEAENPLRVFFGERLDIAFGLRPEAAYLAFGAQPIAIIKEAVGRSALAISKPIPPLELRLSVGKLAQMVAATSQEPLPSQARAIATQAQAGSGRDQVTLTLDRVSGGLRCRIRAEEGLLRVLVAAWARAIPR